MMQGQFEEEPERDAQRQQQGAGRIASTPASKQERPSAWRIARGITFIIAFMFVPTVYPFPGKDAPDFIYFVLSPFGAMLLVVDVGSVLHPWLKPLITILIVPCLVVWTLVLWVLSGVIATLVTADGSPEKLMAVSVGALLFIGTLVVLPIYGLPGCRVGVLDMLECAGKDPQLEKARINRLGSEAKAGDPKSAAEFARVTNNQIYLKALAVSGNVVAAAEFAKLTGDTSYLKPIADAGSLDAAKEFAQLGEFHYLEKLARSGDDIAAWQLYQHRKVPATAEAWQWLCYLANKEKPEAQNEVGMWHQSKVWGAGETWNDVPLRVLREIGVRPDNRLAYMWYTLGKSDVYSRNRYVAPVMTHDEVEQAEQMARDWKPGDCPSAEHRLPPPGER